MYISIKPFGQWAQARRASSNLSSSIKRSIRAAEEKVAKRLIKIVKGHILNQDLPWKALAIETQERKGHDRVYIDSFTYLTSLKYWQKDYTVHIGIPRGIIEPRSKVELYKVAVWMEYGTKGGRRMPARPLWGPSVAELGGSDGMNEIVRETISARLAKDGWDLTRY
jgi:hypothetical protein